MRSCVTTDSERLLMGVLKAHEGIEALFEWGFPAISSRVCMFVYTCECERLLMEVF
jgi:hypothetical protein